MHRLVAALVRIVRATRAHPERAIIGVLACGAAVAITAAAANAASGVARFNDFYREAAPSYVALIHGHAVGFARLLPAYGGSLVIRAPFALLAGLWGGSLREVYFASALPCVLAAVAFCAWLAAQTRRRVTAWPERIGVVAWTTATLIVLVVYCFIALSGGHPEELLGAVLCVAAVMLAADGRAEWAGVLAGLAVANKSWALVAIPVVMAALPARRGRALLLVAASAGAVLLPIALARQHGLSAAANGADVGVLFNPPQLLWWLGHRSWIVREARPGIVLASLLLSVLWYRTRRRNVQTRASRAPEALLLLALVLLLRAALDPWNNLWYHIPFLFALLTFEARAGRAPIVMITYAVALRLVVPFGLLPISGNLRAAIYAAITLPILAGLAVKLYPPRALLERLRAARRQTPAHLRTRAAGAP